MTAVTLNFIDRFLLFADRPIHIWDVLAKASKSVLGMLETLKYMLMDLCGYLLYSLTGLAILMCLGLLVGGGGT